MSYIYAVLGAGRQGTAAAYDLARFGQADTVHLVDADQEIARAAAERVNRLLARQIARPARLDVTDIARLVEFLENIDVGISAVPYRFNPGITEAAIRGRASLCDLGGNTEIVLQQLARHEDARKASVSIIPDCGMAPGFTANLAAYAMTLLNVPEEVYIWDGGLPQHPEPPWNYRLTFHFEGLINEYYGTTEFLHDGKLVQVASFTEHETLTFPEPFGALEAFVTTGGTSTAPRTYLGKLRVYQNKTLRYPGHYQQWKVFKDAGFFETEPVEVYGQAWRPRDLLRAVVEPQIRARPGEPDAGLIRVQCLGQRGGQRAEAVLQVIDYFDSQTGFTAMERLTGWHAAIVAGMMARGEAPRGAVPLERAIPGGRVVAAFRQRGIEVQENVRAIT